MSEEDDDFEDDFDDEDDWGWNVRLAPLRSVETLILIAAVMFGWLGGQGS